MFNRTVTELKHTAVRILREWNTDLLLFIYHRSAYLSNINICVNLFTHEFQTSGNECVKANSWCSHYEWLMKCNRDGQCAPFSWRHTAIVKRPTRSDTTPRGLYGYALLAPLSAGTLHVRRPSLRYSDFASFPLLFELFDTSITVATAEVWRSKSSSECNQRNISACCVVALLLESRSLQVCCISRVTASCYIICLLQRSQRLSVWCARRNG
jgi:hypothetical protein